MSADTPSTELFALGDVAEGSTPTAAGTEVAAGGIRSLRKMRGSVPISADLFTATSNPMVIAFQVSVVFAAEHGEEMSWAALQRRWSASRRAAAEARRVLIDLGYWAEVRARQADGRFRTETRTWEARMTEDDLVDLAAEYATSSVIVSGGRTFLVTPSGLLERAAIPASGQGARHRTTKTGNSVRPAETPVTTVTDIPELVTRSDQAIVDNPVTELPESVTRSDQRKQDGSAGRTELPELVTQHACLSFGETNACMHDEFWPMIERLAKVPIDPGGRKSVHEQLTVAFQAGWSPERLARWLGEQVTAAKRLSNPAGFVVARLREIPPPAVVPPSPEEVEALAIEGCEFCDEDGLIGRQRCDHDPNGAARIFAARAERHSGPGKRPRSPHTARRAAR